VKAKDIFTKATQDVISNSGSQLRTQAERGKQQVQAKMKQGSHAINEHPYISIGIAALLGAVLVGVFSRSKHDSDTDI